MMNRLKAALIWAMFDKPYAIRLAVLATVIACGICIVGIGVNAQDATRTYNAPCRPYRLLAKQHNAASDVFPTADPSPAGTPLALTNAMGISNRNGQVTLELGSIPEPVLLTAYQWIQDNVTTSNSHWARVGPSATGSDVYQKSVDTDYVTVQFSIAERTPWLIRADKSVTGNVYVDCDAHPSNTGSTATGY